MSTNGVDLGMLNAALLIVRLVVGLTIAAHGAQKLFGWFGGYGIRGTGEFMVQLGFGRGALFATAAGLGEFGGGVLLALGFFSPFGPALIISVMIVAIMTVHLEHGLFVTNNGFELPLTNAVVALALGLVGPGAYSLDALLGVTDLWTPGIRVTVLGLGVLGGFGNLLLRHRPTRSARV